MAVEVFTNDGLGTVTAGGTTAPAPGTVESWTVTAANGFPVAAAAATSFYVADLLTANETEKILVTVAPGGVSAGQAWTVTRGADGTTPVAHTAGFSIGQAVTRAGLQALQQNLGAAINAVTQFGADKTGATDSTAAINNAITAAGPGIVYLPVGTYLLNGSTSLNFSIASGALAGDGVGSTVIKVGSSFTAAQAINITANSIEIRDLQITGANTGNSAVGGTHAWNGIEITGAQHCSIHDVFIQFTNGYAIESIGTSSVANVDCTYRVVVHRNCAAGIHVIGNTTTSFNGEQFFTDIQGQQVGTTTGPSANLDAWLIEDVHDIIIANPNVGVVAGTGHALHIRGAASGVFATNLDIGGGSGVVLIEDNGGNSPTQIRLANGNIQSSTAGAGLHGTGAGSDWMFDSILFRNNQTDGCTLANTGALSCSLTGCKWNTNNQANSTAYDLNFASATTKWQVNGGVFLTAVGSGAGLVTHPVNDPNSISTLTGTQFLGTSTTTGNLFAAGPLAWLGLTVGATTGWSLGDATASHVVAAATQAAGSQHLLADSGHVHPADTFAVADHGLLAANFDPLLAASVSLTTAGTVYLMKVQVRSAFTWTNVWFNLQASASGTSTGSFAGLYNSSGTLLSGSSDMIATLTAAAGAKSVALTTPQALSAGTFVWVAILTNASVTQPTLSRSGSASSASNVNLTAATSRIAISATVATTLAAFTPSALTSGSALAFWVGAT